ncbi:MAG: hypothetical protein V3S46_09970 [Nitrospinota bacterium]
MSLSYNAYSFSLNTDNLIPERRKDQFPSESAWYLIPFPYNYPGIGSGIAWMANASNVLDTPTDATLAYVTGDVGGTLYSVKEFHLIPKTIFIGYEAMNLDKLALQNYDQRGMDTNKDDFTIIESNKYSTQEANITFSFWERRLELNISHQTDSIKMIRIRDSDGDVISDLTDPYKSSTSRTTGTLAFDLTDDWQDPRKGARLELSRRDSPRDTSDDPNFFVMNYNLKLYYPIGKISTLAFNYFRSDAHVTSKGTTDRNTIIGNLDLDCTAGDTECETTQEDLIQRFINQNTNGSSASLGGPDRLRSYGDGRFKGAHMEFLAVEMRWNLREEFTPFNYFIWKDTRTGIQVAFFAETGTVSETTGDLWKRSRASYGAGLRMVTGSGFVYRLEIAAGDEGIEPVLLFYYPW